MAAEKIDKDNYSGPYLFGVESDLYDWIVTALRGASTSGMIAMAGLMMFNSLVPS